MKSVFDEKKEKISMTTIRERSIEDMQLYMGYSLEKLERRLGLN